MATRPAPGSISATELATLGLCETQFVLNGKFGQGTPSERQQASRDRGNAVHESARLAAIHGAPATDRRCFIATALYGADAPQTNLLRHWRDAVLLRRWYGPAVVATYYRLSPHLVGLLLGRPRTASVVRCLVGRLVTRCDRTLSR